MILAYIDPGAGSMVVQALLATLLAIPFVFRSAIGRVLERVRRRPVTQKDDTGSPD